VLFEISSCILYAQSFSFSTELPCLWYTFKVIPYVASNIHDLLQVFKYSHVKTEDQTHVPIPFFTQNNSNNNYLKSALCASFSFVNLGVSFKLTLYPLNVWVAVINHLNLHMMWMTIIFCAAWNMFQSASSQYLLYIHFVCMVLFQTRLIILWLFRFYDQYFNNDGAI
jgi:hypothetical protein